MGKLTAAAVRTAKHNPAKGARPIRKGDGEGLYLQVAQGNHQVMAASLHPPWQSAGDGS